MTYFVDFKNRVCAFTGTCFIQKIYAPSSSLLQGKHLPFSPSPLLLNIFRLFVKQHCGFDPWEHSLEYPVDGILKIFLLK
jgi:hypothetical protein